MGAPGQSFMDPISQAFREGKALETCMKATLLLAAEGIYRQRAESGDLRTIVKHPSST